MLRSHSRAGFLPPPFRRAMLLMIAAAGSVCGCLGLGCGEAAAAGPWLKILVEGEAITALASDGNLHVAFEATGNFLVSTNGGNWSTQTGNANWLVADLSYGNG